MIEKLYLAEDCAASDRDFSAACGCAQPGIFCMRILSGSGPAQEENNDMSCVFSPGILVEIGVSMYRYKRDTCIVECGLAVSGMSSKVIFPASKSFAVVRKYLPPFHFMQITLVGVEPVSC